MESLGQTLLLAFALIFVIEGLLYAVFPRHIQNILTVVADMKPEKLRPFGGAMIAFGVLLVWLFQKL